MLSFWDGIDNQTSWEYHEQYMNLCDMLNAISASTIVPEFSDIFVGVHTDNHIQTTRNLFI